MRHKLSIRSILFLALFFFTTSWAQLGTVNLNTPDTPTYYQMLGLNCPKPINCTYGSNFLHLSDATFCGCCKCNGGPIGCSGGSKGQIVCADGTYAQGCRCQYLVQ